MCLLVCLKHCIANKLFAIDLSAKFCNIMLLRRLLNLRSSITSHNWVYKLSLLNGPLLNAGIAFRKSIL
jgi:hypothetical protein